MNTLVLDIETKQTFAELGGKGREFLDKMEMSVCGVYSYKKNEYYCYGEDEFEKLKALLSEKALLVGFSSNKFDLPIINRTLGLDLMSYPRVDISDEIERQTGRLIGLSKLATANLKINKFGNAVSAPDLYRDGRIKELKEYCEQDVKITKELYDLIKKQSWLLIPDRNSETPVKIEIRLDHFLLL
ncbi:MAG: ribonuclease H-like domain-containing protein [bacterium]|nr:ribonuclease H-like domain-containing protein [bacterium]